MHILKVSFWELKTDSRIYWDNNLEYTISSNTNNYSEIQFLVVIAIRQLREK